MNTDDMLRVGVVASAHGIKGEVKLRTRNVILEVALQGTQGHIVAIDARLFWFVIDGKDARVEFIIVTEVFLGHSQRVEKFFLDIGVFMFILSPVKLPAGVCTQFVVSGIESVRQGEVSPAFPVLHLQYLSFYEIAVLVEEFYIQHSTDFAGQVAVGAASIDSIPNGVAQEVASVVHVYIYLFLRDIMPEGVQPSCPLLNVLGHGLVSILSWSDVEIL